MISPFRRTTNSSRDSYRRKAWIRSFEEIITDFSYNGDTMTAEERLMDPNRGFLKPGGTYYGNVGWFTYKYAPYRCDLVTNSSTDTDNNAAIVMRYAEVLLLYAEACAQTGDNDGLKDQGKEVPSFVDEFVEGSKPHKAKVVYDNAYYNTEYGFKAGKNELMPYPFGELSLNPNIKQNPGWE